MKVPRRPGVYGLSWFRDATSRRRRRSSSVTTSLDARVAVGVPVSALMAAVIFAVAAPIASARQATHSAPSAANVPAAATVNVVAHNDDDLLFLNPDIYRDVRAGRRVRSVFVSAGDRGMGSTYWGAREEGAKAAYAYMAGVPNSWHSRTLLVAGHPIQLATLMRKPAVSLVFMRLPSGADGGRGYASRDFESLRKLWTGKKDVIHAVDGSTSYTKTSLQQTITALLLNARPTVVRTQDYLGGYDDGDHTDHYTVGYLTKASSAQLPFRHMLISYEGYNISGRPRNLSPLDSRTKEDAFFVYSAHDSRTCKSAQDCRRRSGDDYYAWFFRQYVIARSTRSVSTAELVGSPS